MSEIAMYKSCDANGTDLQVGDVVLVEEIPCKMRVSQIYSENHVFLLTMDGQRSPHRDVYDYTQVKLIERTS